MSLIPEAVSKYLKKFSDKNWSVETNNLSGINNVIVIPAIAEYENLIILLSSLRKNNQKYFGDTLILFVINNTSSASPDVKNNNIQSLDYLRKEIINSVQGSGLRIGLIDAASPGNELCIKHGGVGLARKTGMDASLSILNYSISKKKVLICLDADCIVSENYLEVIINNFNEKNLAAASIYFEHDIDNDSGTTEAIICYEIFLRYYVLGLKVAGSPYAFETVGSAMACDYESYIKIGGMNKLKAAEDFYFLEKLSKCTNIYPIKDAAVYPSGRRSWRVPFGTGQRVGRFLDKIKDEYVLYDTNSFIILKQWLNIYRNSTPDAISYIEEAEKINKELAAFLRSQGFESALNKIRMNSKNEAQISKHKNIWFDGFRTLKLIHHLRDNGFPQIKMFDALDELFSYFSVSVPFRNNKEGPPHLTTQKDYLYLLRSLESKLD